jgi:DNA-binding GntR family transcriptional regulator
MTRRADDVLRRVRADIVAGVHPPGARLTESSLTAAYDVSRVPVREALKQLEVEGFVTSRAYAGVTVAHLDADEAADLFTVRRTIEEITTARCARRFRDGAGTPDVVAFGEALEHLVATGCGAVESPDRSGLAPLNTEFHLSLAEFSGSTSMLSLLRQVSSKIEWLYAMDVDVRGPHSWSEHRAIADAVVAGKVGDARRLMRQHVTNSLEGYLTRHLPTQEDA